MTIQGRRQYLWRAGDQDGDVIDILVQPRRDRRAAERFFRKLLKGQGREPRRLITDKLGSYSAAHRTVMPSVVHSTARYLNNRAEVSHQPTRQRERQMRGRWAQNQTAIGVAGNAYQEVEIVTMTQTATSATVTLAPSHYTLSWSELFDAIRH